MPGDNAREDGRRERGHSFTGPMGDEAVAVAAASVVRSAAADYRTPSPYRMSIGGRNAHGSAVQSTIHDGSPATSGALVRASAGECMSDFIHRGTSGGAWSAPPSLFGEGEPSKPPRVFLSWRDVSVKVRMPLGKSRWLLYEVSGYAEPGSLVAMMGASGSGKTTLLNALAGRLGNAVMERGEVLLNGKNQRLAYGNLAYVMQDDALIPTLSVFETMMYAAHLQLPPHMSTYDKQVRVHRVIRDMGLQRCVNTRIGGWHQRGLSGGEKRRLSIAIETIKQPALLFLDEPTSGLDSAASIHVVKRLKALAKTGRTVVMSIHQPSSESFEMIDFLTLLSHGRTVFFGARAETKKFYDSAGFPCPNFRNPSDHFLWVINSDFDNYQDPDDESVRGPNRAQNAQTLIKFYKESTSCSFVNAKIRHGLIQEREDLNIGGESPDFYAQAYYLTSRSFIHMFRDLTYYWFRLFVYVILAIVLGTIYFQIGLSYNAIQARACLLMFVTGFLSLMGVMSFPSFVEDLRIFTRERLNGHYGVAAFVIANTLSSFPFIAVICLLPGSIVYALSGLHPGLGHFGFFYASLLACLFASEGLLMSVASLVPDYLSGMMAGCGIMGIYTLTGGFFRYLDELPKPIWRYPFSYISINTWANRALYNNDFGGLHFENIVQGAPRIPGHEIVDQRFHLGISYSKWWPTFALICMAVFYRILFFFAMKLRENLPRLRHKLRHKKVVVMTEKALSGRLTAFSGRLSPFSGKIVAPSDTEYEADDVELMSNTSFRGSATGDGKV
ncbi:hypothetical protein KP509_03G101300 [Ceratopteris richardii]|uniref:ABC transporter domain-containing protein n=1 Tax=Ceratopteris richardii TaxID=49495 RepID=A0A8T2V6P1_CERRI|nr:hypothetical protein KP509_03G101300 [Ceratopteris richardii]